MSKEGHPKGSWKTAAYRRGLADTPQGRKKQAWGDSGSTEGDGKLSDPIPEVYRRGVNEWTPNSRTSLPSMV